MTLVSDSAILRLADALGSSLEAIRLRFANAVVADVSDLELRADVDELDEPYEAACVIAGDELQCSPWPEVTQAVDNHKHSALTLILLAPPTLNIPSSSMGSTSALDLITTSSSLELTLDQEVEFF